MGLLTDLWRDPSSDHIWWSETQSQLMWESKMFCNDRLQSQKLSLIYDFLEYKSIFIFLV